MPSGLFFLFAFRRGAHNTGVPQSKAATNNTAHRAKLMVPALVGEALISDPCTNRSTTIPIANTSPRGNHVVIGEQPSEYRHPP